MEDRRYTTRREDEPQVAFTESQLNDLADRIAMRLNDSGCACGLPLEARVEMPHLIGMYKDIGDGEYFRGIEIARDVIKAGKEQRRLSKVILGIGVIMGATAFFGWVGAAVWSALRASFK